MIDWKTTFAGLGGGAVIMGATAWQALAVGIRPGSPGLFFAWVVYP